VVAIDRQKRYSKSHTRITPNFAEGQNEMQDFLSAAASLSNVEYIQLTRALLNGLVERGSCLPHHIQSAELVLEYLLHYEMEITSTNFDECNLEKTK
jgi:hypothetical protein